MKKYERLTKIKTINTPEDLINGVVYQGDEIVVHMFDRTGAGRKDIFRMPNFAVFIKWALERDDIISISDVE